MKPTAPPRTRRPIPQSRRMWEREVAGIKKYLSKLGELTGDFGAEWAAKQGAYYRERLADLLEHEPIRSTRGTGSRNRRRSHK